PNSKWRYYPSPVFSEDNQDWRHFALVVNEEENYWAVYFNGQETYREEFIETLAGDFNYLEFDGDMGTVSLDELVIWGRPLLGSEIATHLSLNAPYMPVESRVAQKEAVLKYFWDFNEGFESINEGGGNQAIDEVSGLTLNLPSDDAWIWRGEENTGIINKWGNDIVVDLPNPLGGKDLSLAFWWRNHLFPNNEGRSLVSLNYNEGSKLGIAPYYYRRPFYFNDIYGVFSQGEDTVLPHDDNWHHFAITYDSYRYELKFYIDGHEKNNLPFVWIKDGEEPNRLAIINQLNSVELDNIAIWEGTLTAEDVARQYQSTLIDNN
ncbi:MAG TPA: LamG-like jellyroll fold domain-containing protein, partial [Patescibacteria group bacterium]|nr:LamG-like jellyroll fold domain-containing protein [Patescibacteria group bacterium]